MDLLHTTAPDFDQPLAVLKHCHDRIRKQLGTLDKLPAHLKEHGADAQAQDAAQAVLRYFRQAAPLHHEDEEVDLLPMLKATAAGDDAQLLQQLVPGILQQHEQMNQLWNSLDLQLQAIAEGNATVLEADASRKFCELYTAHMHTEETHIATMAKRLFSDEQMASLGSAMQRRRGITAQSNSKQ
jgi:pyridoxamine 5'-phosphate oxidase